MSSSLHSKPTHWEGWSHAKIPQTILQQQQQQQEEEEEQRNTKNKNHPVLFEQLPGAPKNTQSATISFQLESFQNQRSQGASQHHTSNVHDDLSQTVEPIFRGRCVPKVMCLNHCGCFSWICFKDLQPGGTTCWNKKGRRKEDRHHHYSPSKPWKLPKPSQPSSSGSLLQGNQTRLLQMFGATFYICTLGCFSMPNTSSLCARENIRCRYLWTYNLNVVWPIRSFKPLMLAIRSSPWLRFTWNLGTNIRGCWACLGPTKFSSWTGTGSSPSVSETLNFKIMEGACQGRFKAGLSVCLRPRTPWIWSYECWESQRTTPAGWQLWNLKRE